MERTINEIYQLIVQKRNNAERDLVIKTSNDKEYNQCICLELKGEIEAYTDVLVLLESSGVVEDELIR